MKSTSLLFTTFAVVRPITAVDPEFALKFSEFVSLFINIAMNSTSGTERTSSQAISSLKNLLERISEIQSLLDESDRFEGRDTESPYERAKNLVETILSETCNIVRSTRSTSSDELEAVVSLADDILNEVVNEVYGDWELHDFLPSFAHTKDNENAQILKDSEVGAIAGIGK